MCRETYTPPAGITKVDTAEPPTSRVNVIAIAASRFSKNRPPAVTEAPRKLATVHVCAATLPQVPLISVASPEVNDVEGNEALILSAPSPAETLKSAEIVFVRASLNHLKR